MFDILKWLVIIIGIVICLPYITRIISQYGPSVVNSAQQFNKQVSTNGITP